MELTLINNLIGYTGNGIAVYTQNLYDNLIKCDINAEKVSIYDYVGSGNLKIKGMRTFKKQLNSSNSFVSCLVGFRFLH